MEEGGLVIGRDVYHYHTLQDGEEGHVHEGGDIRHEHESWGYVDYNRVPRHERLRQDVCPTCGRPR